MSCWDECLVENFLQEYRKHECLWNPFHSQFHDCIAKGEALKRLVRNARLDFGVQDCLRLLKRIREKYIEDQTKILLNLRNNLCQPKWMQIVESMLEKIIGDEDCKTNYLTSLRCIKSKSTTTPVKVLFRHTIASKKRKCIPASLKQKRRKKRAKRQHQRGKLERRGRCCENATRDMDPCRAAQDCSRSQSNWCKQRDDYLDKLTWKQPCPEPIDCPGLASHIERVSRIENIGKDPCSTTPVYLCPNRDTHVNCNFNQNHGRRRHTDIYPTIPESRSCRSPTRQPACSPPRKPSPERNLCPPKREKKICCPPSTPEDKCPCPEKKKSSKDVCTRETCPSYQRRCSSPPKESKIICEIVKTECPDRSVRFDAKCSPRVAARFENGVLEAYSQFKLVFPSQDNNNQSSSSKKKCSTQKVQTDRTTCECAVGVSSRELLRKRSSSGKCPRRKSAMVGTDEDFIECCPESNKEVPEDSCHDFVLLTPGGKYVPLTRTKSEIKDDDKCPCIAEIQREDPCEMRREPSPPRNSEKVEEDKCPCPSNTTKLLLRCLEHMLNLEEQQQQQQQQAKIKDDDICEPCRRKEQQKRCYEQATEQISNCLPCNTESNSPRGKLTQNFLDILKCAMELDNNAAAAAGKDECCCQEDTSGCRCDNEKNNNDDEMIQRKVSVKETAAGGMNCVNIESKATQDAVVCVDKEIQCDARRSRDKHSKRDTVLNNLVRCANWPEYKTARNLSVALKCDEDEQQSNITRVPATTLPNSPPRKSYQRDPTLACLREELQRDKEYFDRERHSYVKCNQVYRSYVMKSPETSPTRSRTRCYR